ncbi:biofilm regulation protein phosphatase SiaA [Pararhodospirillum oryzae]|uniref:HAMP domain-containing protein n=1 Tax=Pararhodospirillum oryzae TaxID=478448 RepID=A0A512H4S4_9PROT|nr:biofilm regulation protein phosphatase SiaA [Pararhodospirillum oryzae]GEO80464.1 hypothetical protein ROR02_05950 [Pararhodospirillum oryzae]
MPHATSRRPFRWGLRAKSVALVLGITVVSLAVLGIGGRILLGDIQNDLGASLARDTALRTQHRTMSEVGLEVALARRFADSGLVRDWLADEDNPAKRARFLEEAEKFRGAFSSHGYFVAVAQSRHFYYASPEAPSPRVTYTVQDGVPENSWYFTTLAQADGIWINVDHDKTLGVTNVWINIAVRDGQDRVLGIVGTGIRLDAFLTRLLGGGETGVTTMILDERGAVVAHPDTRRIAFDLAARPEAENTVFRLADDDGSRARLAALLRVAPEQTHLPSTRVSLEGHSHLVATASVPTLGWVVLSAVDMRQKALLTPDRLVLAAAIISLVVLATAGLTALGFDALIVRPLVRLSGSIEAVRTGTYRGTALPSRRDELGALTRAFDAMARQVQANAEHLEHLVAARTDELAAVNDRLQDTHQRLTDSIRYASLLQKAILPDSRLDHDLPGRVFVLWRPRDVVGGDFYVYRGDDQSFLLGVVDCAGHGVPGACMTMLAHAALDMALREAPWSDPAAVLARVDAIARAMLPGTAGELRLATTMDMGLAHVDRRTGVVTFAGARMPLLWSDGANTGQLPAGRRGLNDRKPGTYVNAHIPLAAGRTFYLVSDGLFDQSGGPRGFGFGQHRFIDWMKENARLPLDDQKHRLEATLDRYQGDGAQRDDITVLAFRFDEGARALHL